MSKKLTIIASCVFGLGLIILIIALASVNFDFNRLSSPSSIIEKNEEYEINRETKLSINVKTTDIKIKQSPDELVHIYYNERENDYCYELSYNNNEIKMVQNISPNQWIRLFTWNFNTYNKVTIELPEMFRNELEVNLTTGDLTIQGVSSFEKLDVVVTTGEVTLDKIILQNLNIQTSTGEVSMNNIEVKDSINVKTTTGDIEIDALKSASLTLKASTGDVEFQEIISDNIVITTNTGYIEGSFEDAITEYTIYSNTSTGKSNLPQLMNGGDKVLNVTTNTGHIKITFND